jgi:hypothetical protein
VPRAPHNSPYGGHADAPNPTLEKKGSATALPGIGGSGNGGLGASSSGTTAPASHSRVLTWWNVQHSFYLFYLIDFVECAGVKTSDDSSRGIERLPSPREISYLSTSLESVFEGSKYLDDQSLEHFIAALVSATLVPLHQFLSLHLLRSSSAKASLSSNALLAYEVKRPATTPSDAATPVNHVRLSSLSPSTGLPHAGRVCSSRRPCLVCPSWWIPPFRTFTGSTPPGQSSPPTSSWCPITR